MIHFCKCVLTGSCTSNAKYNGCSCALVCCILVMCPAFGQDRGTPPPIVLCALRFSAWSQEGFARCYLQRFSISCVTAISKDHHHLGCVAFREQLDVTCFRPLRKGWEWLTKEARCPTSNIQDLSCEGRFGVTRQEWPGAQSVTCKCGYSRARLSRISKAFPSETAVPKAPRGVVTFLFPISSSCGVVDAVPRR